MQYQQLCLLIFLFAVFISQFPLVVEKSGFGDIQFGLGKSATLRTNADILH